MLKENVKMHNTSSKKKKNSNKNKQVYLYCLRQSHS